MELCDNGHDEICFETVYCPLCEIKEELTNTLADCEELNNKLESVEDNYDKLVQKVKEVNPELLI